MYDQDVNIIKRSITGILSTFDYQKLELEPRWLKEIRLAVRKNDQVMAPFVDRLFSELHKEDCDRRLGVLLIADYFFQRSHAFRTELIGHIQDFCLYTLETDPLHYPLPSPPEAAATLKKEALKVVKAWIDKFERGYTKLKTASQYLHGCKHFDFMAANEQLQVERRRAEEARLREEARARALGEKTRKKLEEARGDIEHAIRESRASIKLIYPNLFEHDDDAESEPVASTSGAMTSEQQRRLHGYKPDEQLEVVINTANIQVDETPHNAPLVIALHDSQVLLERYAKSIKKWLKHLTSASGVAENATLVRELIDAKARVEHELKRGEQLKIRRRAHVASDSESDGDFEAVIKEGLEVAASNADADEDDEPTAAILERIDRAERSERRAACAARRLEENEGDAEPQPSTSDWSAAPVVVEEAAASISAKVPKLQFGLDLKYWGQDVEPATVPRNEFDGHRFWRARDPADDVAQEAAAVYSSRQMTFLTERPSIKHKCRAPLPSGKLCPRMDLQVCPFHGPIVPRDDMGFPVEELGTGSATVLKNADARIRQQLAEDEREYVRDVEAAVGVALAPRDKREQRRALNHKAHGTARKREKTQTALTRERLQNKLFDRSAMRRVAETLTAAQQQRASKNFSSQFNYAVSRR